MCQHERDVLRVMSPVLKGERTQGEAARLLGIHRRSLQRKLSKDPVPEGH